MASSSSRVLGKERLPPRYLAITQPLGASRIRPAESRSRIQTRAGSRAPAWSQSSDRRRSDSSAYRGEGVMRSQAGPLRNTVSRRLCEWTRRVLQLNGSKPRAYGSAPRLFPDGAGIASGERGAWTEVDGGVPGAGPRIDEEGAHDGGGSSQSVTRTFASSPRTVAAIQPIPIPISAGSPIRVPWSGPKRRAVASPGGTE